MSDQTPINTAAPGTPSIVVNTGLKPEVVKLDTNQVDQQTETRWEWLQNLAIPATLAEINLQMLSYTLGMAFVVNTMRSLAPLLPQVIIPAAMMLVMGTLVSLYAVKKIPASRFFIGYRLFWLAAGVCLAYYNDLLSLALQFIQS